MESRFIREFNHMFGQLDEALDQWGEGLGRRLNAQLQLDQSYPLPEFYTLKEGDTVNHHLSLFRFLKEDVTVKRKDSKRTIEVLMENKEGLKKQYFIRRLDPRSPIKASYKEGELIITVSPPPEESEEIEIN